MTKQQGTWCGKTAKELKKKLIELGMNPAQYKGRGQMGLAVFCTENNLAIPKLARKASYFHDFSVHQSRQYIYEIIVGAGVAQEVLHHIQATEHKDTLNMILLLLEGQGIIHIFNFPEIQTSLDPVIKPTETSNIIADITRIAKFGIPKEIKHHDLNSLLKNPKPRRGRRFNVTKLPPELQDMIWFYVVELSGRNVQLHRYKNRLRTTTPPPIAMHLNSRCRAVAKMVYVPCELNLVWIHPLLDTVYIGARSVVFTLTTLDFVTDKLDDRIVRNAPHIAIGTTRLAEMGLTFYDIHKWTNLKTVKWAVHETSYVQMHRVEFEMADSDFGDENLKRLIPNELREYDRNNGVTREEKDMPVSVQVHPKYFARY